MTEGKKETKGRKKGTAWICDCFPASISAKLQTKNENRLKSWKIGFFSIFNRKQIFLFFFDVLALFYSNFVSKSC